DLRSRNRRSRSSLSLILEPTSRARARCLRRSPFLPATASARAKASYAKASGKSSMPFSLHVARDRTAWYVAGSGRPRTEYTWDTCHSPIARFTAVPTSPQWKRDACAAWIMRSSSAGVRLFSRSRQTSLNRLTALFRCHLRSAVVSFRAMGFPRCRRFSRQRRGVGLGRFELPSQAPKARRIDQATPQPQIRGRTGTRDKYVVAYVPRGLRIDDHTSRAAARTASSLVFVGRHPVLLRRSSASCIVRTSPAQPRPAPAPPVQPYSTPSRPSSRHTASARARTVIASPLPT